MADDDRVKPTPSPRCPALVRPSVGALLLSLSAAGGLACKSTQAPPPMPPPMPDPGYGVAPMAQEVHEEDLDEGEGALEDDGDNDEALDAESEDAAIESPPPMPAPR